MQFISESEIYCATCLSNVVKYFVHKHYKLHIYAYTIHVNALISKLHHQQVYDEIICSLAIKSAIMSLMKVF